MKGVDFMYNNQNGNNEKDNNYVRINKKALLVGVTALAGAGVSIILYGKLREANHQANLIKAQNAIKTLIDKSKEQGVIENKIKGYVKCNQNIEHIKARVAEDRACQDIVDITVKDILDLIK